MARNKSNKLGRGFHSVHRVRLEAREVSTHEDVLDCLRETVLSGFTGLTGLVAVLAPLAEHGTAMGTHQPALAHPNCAEHLGNPYCRRSGQAHIARLQKMPEPHWHRCKLGKLCAIVPVVVNDQCFAACHLVCPPPFIGDEVFERYVELLDMLIDNFVTREHENLARVVGQGERSPRPASQVRHPQVIEALEYIRTHLTDINLSVGGVARRLGVNASYLAHLFSEQVGIRMSRYIARHRIELAKQLLIDTDWQIKRVAYESGHANTNWFTSIFHAHTGVAPTRFRERARLLGS